MKNEIAGLPAEFILGLPSMSLVGNIKIEILNHRGLKNYSDKKVLIYTRIGDLVIDGDKLLIKEISLENIKIEGNISAVSFTNLRRRSD